MRRQPWSESASLLLVEIGVKLLQADKVSCWGCHPREHIKHLVGIGLGNAAVQLLHLDNAAMPTVTSKFNHKQQCSKTYVMSTVEVVP